MSEKVDYRYNLYNKDDIHLVLGVTDIVRPYLSAAVKHSFGNPWKDFLGNTIRMKSGGTASNDYFSYEFYEKVENGESSGYYTSCSSGVFSNPVEDSALIKLIQKPNEIKSCYYEDSDTLYVVSGRTTEKQYYSFSFIGYKIKIKLENVTRYGKYHNFLHDEVNAYADLANIKIPELYSYAYVKNEDCLYEPHKNEDSTYEWQKIPSSGLIRSVKTLAELNSMEVSSGDYDGASVYVEAEDNWYFYHPIYKKWLIENSQTYTYAAMFYFEYSNDNSKERAKVSFNPRFAIWKTIEDAKNDLANMSFSYIDCTADEGRTFFIVDNGRSKLLTPLEQYRQEDISAMYSVGQSNPMTVALMTTRLIPTEKNQTAYILRFNRLMQYLNAAEALTPYEESGKETGKYSYNDEVEGVQPTGGITRLQRLLKAWDGLEKDNGQYLSLADAVKSDGYAQVTASE